MTYALAERFPAPLRAVDDLVVRSRDGGLDVRAELVVGADPEQLRGHFPDLPILPGVFLLECLTQSVAAAVDEPQPALTELVSARFRAPFLPGDTVRLEARLRAAPEGGWDVRADARHSGDTPSARLVARYGGPVPTAAGPGDVPDGPGALTHDQVRERLPHRHPMLLIDRVRRCEPGRRIVAEKAVTATEPCYRDVAGDYPVSLMLESLGQAAALLWLDGPPDPGSVLMFAGLRDYRVTGAARPGDVLRHVVELVHVKAQTAFATGATWLDSRRIASASSIAAVHRPRGRTVIAVG